MIQRRRVIVNPKKQGYVLVLVTPIVVSVCIVVSLVYLFYKMFWPPPHVMWIFLFGSALIMTIGIIYLLILGVCNELKERLQ